MHKTYKAVEMMLVTVPEGLLLLLNIVFWKILWSIPCGYRPEALISRPWLPKVHGPLLNFYCSLLCGDVRGR